VKHSTPLFHSLHHLTSIAIHAQRLRAHMNSGYVRMLTY